uniref:COesterase domain-containing protein n=1 Tax=Angiostrongylus cantonensis TaxID=6313 RepID=A0A158P6I1_ANGCA
VDAFQGVPYANPPVGNLRFRKPEPPEPWEGVRETKAFAASSIQKPTLLERKLGNISEDCLYLNVFTPVWSPSSASGFAVLVFIHGGGFVSDSTTKYGDCTKDVVVVTVQYRVGFLGFFSTGDEYCRGNFGLWDQILALKWIQENISFFNGNQNNVTAMGQSSGAGNMIDILRGLPASKFAVSLMDTLDMSECVVGPCIDGDLIPKNVSELRKEAPTKPMLIGCCSSEGLMCKLSGFRPTINGNKLKVLGDLFINIAIQRTVLDVLETHSAPVYFYSFDYYNPKSWGPLSLYFRWPFKDASHCTDLTYVFAVGIHWDFQLNEDDKKMLEFTTRMWTNFAKYG